MIKITSIQQALSLKGTVPELAIIRAIQFMGNGYDPERDGHIIVIQKGDNLAQILGKPSGPCAFLNCAMHCKKASTY